MRPWNWFAVAAALSGVLAITGCDQLVTRQFGGKQTIDLPCGKKLVNVTWKGNDLWFLTRDAQPNESFTGYKFNESSGLGVFEGTVTINESVCPKQS